MSPVRLSAAIMAHPKRRAMVADLEASLDGPARTVWDERGSVWHTAKRAIAAFYRTATHHVVLQDDAMPCRDLLAGLERALAFVPEDVPVGLYFGAPSCEEHEHFDLATIADENRASWVVLERIVWGPAVVYPIHLIPDILHVADRVRNPSYDLRVGGWCRKRGIDAWHTWPSLVDHRDTPSLIGKPQGRSALRFVGTERSALDVDWAGAVIGREYKVRRAG